MPDYRYNNTESVSAQKRSRVLNTGRDGWIGIELLRRENGMSAGAIGGVGAIGVGAMGGMGAGAQAGALTPGGMLMILESANGVAKSVATQQMASLAPSAVVDISGAAQTSLASDGLQVDASMGELAQTLIVALLLQLLLGSQSGAGTSG